MDTYKQKFAKQRADQLRTVLDQVADPKGNFRKDTETGIFAQQLVIHTFRELFRHQFEPAKWFQAGLMPLNTSVPSGATQYSYVEQVNVGRAKIIADDATDLPIATIEGRNNLLPIKTVGIAIKYSIQEIETAQMQGMFDIVSSKVSAAREGHDLEINDYIRDGVPASGLFGITNAPGIILTPATTGNWVAGAATAAQVIADIRSAINPMIENSNGVEVPNTVVMPLEEWNYIRTVKVNPGFNDDTIMSSLMNLFPQITRWDWDPGMSTASPTGGRALVCYRNDPSRLRGVMPLMMTPTAPEQKGLSFVLNFRSRWGGVMVPRPRSVNLLTGI